MGRAAFITDLGLRQKTLSDFLCLPFQGSLMCTIIAITKICSISLSRCPWVKLHITSQNVFYLIFRIILYLCCVSINIAYASGVMEY